MDPFIINFLLILVVSLVISSYGNLVGFGGGVFMVPLLVSFFHYPFNLAVGSVMIALVPASLIATYFRRKEGFVDFRMGIMLELPTMIGVICGSLLLTYLKVEILELFFVLFILGLGVSFLVRRGKEKQANTGGGVFYRLNKFSPKFIIKNEKHTVAYRASAWMILFFGMLSGLLAGIFGIGGGFLKTPIMIKVFKIPAKIAASTALFMIVITSLTGSISHYFQGHILIEKALPVLIGFSIGSLLGKKFNMLLDAKTLEKLIGISLVLAALVMGANLV